MPVIAIQGIRGGTGTTSVAAGLAWALQKLGESIMLIDFSPDNLLRLHFNMPFEQNRGWARACIDHSAWQESALRYTTLLDFIPFGRISWGEQPKLEDKLRQNSAFWRKNIAQLIATNEYRWIILDVPSGEGTSAQQGLGLSDRIIFLLNPDIACHVRLHQQKLPEHCCILLNKYSPSNQLQRDLYQLWQKTIPNLLPIMIHLDQALAESLAVKQPVGECAPESLATQELNTLANWCLINFSKNSP